MLDQRGLAGAVFADEAEDAAARDGERDGFQSDLASEPTDEVLDHDRGIRAIHVDRR